MTDYEMFLKNEEDKIKKEIRDIKLSQKDFIKLCSEVHMYFNNKER